MSNVLVFIISVAVAAILFSLFGGMVNKSAEAHRLEEERQRRRQAQQQLGDNITVTTQKSHPTTIQLDDTAQRWLDTNSLSSNNNITEE